ncbi:MAG: hypothetical protein IJ174_03200 [Clostridia bacterium]|nr:hypothetical protein [Clostridia bacterium]
MQKQTQTPPSGGVKKKDTVKPVAKPYLTGKPWNKNSLKRALKVFGTSVAFAFVNIVVGSALSLDSAFLRVLLNTLMILICLAVLYSEGVSSGDADVAFGEICYAQKKEGRKVSKDDEARCYHRLHGLLSGLLGMVPFFLITVPYAFMATKQVYTLQSLPSWASAYSGIEGIGDALSYYNQHVAMGLADVLRLLERILCLPYANIFSPGGAEALLLMDRLSPLFMLLPAIAYWIGYLRGPRSRAMVHGNIQFSQRRRDRKRRREIRQRQRRNEPKELV